MVKILVLLELQTLKRIETKLRYHVDVEVFPKKIGICRNLQFGEKTSKGSRDQHARRLASPPAIPDRAGEWTRSASFFISLLYRIDIYIYLYKFPITILILFLNNTSTELIGDFGFHWPLLASKRSPSFFSMK